MNALRANRYHEEDQILDKNKHTNSVLESDISSRSSQSSEHEGKDDDISNLQNKKGKHDQNKKKKAKKYHQVQEVKPQLSLEDSTNRKHNSKKPQNEKYKQDLNDEKESKRLEKNANEIFLALQNKNLKKAERLIKKGVIVYARDKVNRTFLHWSVENGHVDIVKLLLDYGADVNAQLAGKYSGVTPLHFAVLGHHTNIVKYLLDYGADVNARDQMGSAPLHVAALGNHEDVIKLLLDYGADVNVKAKKGITPLVFALKFGHSKVVDLLLADPNINVGCIDLKSVKNGEGKRKYVIKRVQDGELFNKVKEVANQKDTGKLDKLLKEIEELLESKNKHGFKPSLNYSPDGNDENTTVEIAIQAGGKLLHLLYAYAEKNISKDTEIFKRLKHAKENSHSKRDLCDVSVFKHSTPDQGFLFSNG